MASIKKKVFIKLERVKKTFNTNSSSFTALHSTWLDIIEGETLGLVGESGSGKSTLGRVINKIYKPDEGDIFYKNINTNLMSRIEFTKNFQMIFQDPYASLNPRMTISDIVGEGLDIHNISSNKIDRKNKIVNLLGKVGLSEENMNRFPHEFSGGQRQRIGIARALAVKPKFIVCDEPISALDVSIQAQVVNLLKNLQREYKLTYLFISHDINMVRYISDRIAVMYKGRIVEIGKTEEIIETPIHPYTKSLLSCIPVFGDSFNREKNLKDLEKINLEKCDAITISNSHKVYL